MGQLEFYIGMHVFGKEALMFGEACPLLPKFDNCTIEVCNSHVFSIAICAVCHESQRGIRLTGTVTFLDSCVMNLQELVCKQLQWLEVVVHHPCMSYLTSGDSND